MSIFMEMKKITMILIQITKGIDSGSILNPFDRDLNRDVNTFQWGS